MMLQKIRKAIISLPTD